MVQVLAVNCLPPVVSAINDDPRCHALGVSYATSASSRASASLGDPRQYQVVVLDMETFQNGLFRTVRTPEEVATNIELSTDEIRAAADYPPVTPDYLEELRRLGAVFIDIVNCSGIPALHGYRYHGQSSSYQVPELSVTDVPSGILFEPFIADYAADFGRNIVTVSSFTDALVVDQHENSIVEIGGTTITVAAVTDIDRRSLVVRDLVTRITFGIFPEVLAGDIQSERVVEITGMLSEARQRYISEKNELERELEDEQAFLARFGPLALSMDDALKNVVIKAFKEIGLEAIDLDTATSGPKTLDVHLTGQSINIETRGRTNRNANVRDVGIIVGHADALDVGQYAGSNSVFVLNGQIGVPARDRDPTFNPTVVQEAESQGVTLMTGSDFLDAVSKIRSADYSTELFLADLRRPGLFSRTAQIELVDE